MVDIKAMDQVYAETDNTLVKCSTLTIARQLMDDYTFSIKDDSNLKQVKRHSMIILFNDGSIIQFGTYDSKYQHGFAGRITTEPVFRLENGLKQC